MQTVKIEFLWHFIECLRQNGTSTSNGTERLAVKDFIANKLTRLIEQVNKMDQKQTAQQMLNIR